MYFDIVPNHRITLCTCYITTCLRCVYQTVGPSSYIIHRLLAQRLHAWAVEVLNTQLLYTHIQLDHDSTTAPLNRIECTCLRSKF